MALPESGWTEADGKLSKSFTFSSFPAALAFMVEVSFFCEKNNHHPDWKNSYRKVEVELTTHDAGAVTGKDHELAAHMDKIFGKFAA
ncbi:4a-hydroxytetrahydrobiopterin dehydratase [Radicibacter daui]|uniref:4a-hydroxytetrahydrobiopterin dehydratase n=1 Tax=Radicibacter daui TaxID=3064829 RepID=UPI004046F97A